MGSGPAPARALDGALGCKGIARQGPSDAGEVTATPLREKPGSGREPTCWGPAQHRPARCAPGGKGFARQNPSSAEFAAPQLRLHTRSAVSGCSSHESHGTSPALERTKGGRRWLRHLRCGRRRLARRVRPVLCEAAG